MPEDSNPSPPKEAARRAETRPRSTAPRIVWGVLLGVLVGAVFSIFILRWRNSDPAAPLAPADFSAARERWNAAAPPNYNIEVQVTGSQPAIYRVEVRDGVATAAFRNGLPLLQHRTFSTWSVPGMFGTMSRDVENVERYAAGHADASTPRLTLRAQFDPRYSFPQRYRRIQWGSDIEVAWNVLKFEVLPNQAASP
jgi:hypothetical protein